MDMVALREQFNLMLIKTMSGSILQNSMFGWGGYGSTIFGVCFIIALFQSFTKGEKEMLVEWTKIVLTSWFALAILGHSAANWQRALPFLNGQGGSLDIAVFNYAKKTFDDIGKQLSQSEGGPAALAQYTVALNNTMDLFYDSVMNCDPENAQCIKEQVTGQKGLEANKPEDEPSGISGIIKILSSLWTGIKAIISNPLMIVFPFLMVIIQVIRGIVEMFMLVTFGMITAIMLMLTKALCPLMILPAYRGRMISLFKTTLSTSLYGFVSHFILWLSIILTKALYMTTGQFFVQQISNMSVAGGASIYFLVITNFFTTLVILMMQVAAIAKIPKICKQLMNLSVEEIVNVGETLLQARRG